VHNRCCRQPQRPQYCIGRSSLPSQHKADCCVERGQIVGNLLIVLSSLLLRHCCHAAASCLPSSLLCQIPQPAPPPFVVLLRPTCSVGSRVARWPPSASQSAPPPLFTPLHLLVVALHHIFWLLGLPSPSHHASASCCAPLVWLVVASCCIAPRPLSPPIAVLEMLLLLSSTSLPLVPAAASSPSPSLLPSLSPPLLSLPSLSTLKGGRGGISCPSQGSKASCLVVGDQRKTLNRANLNRAIFRPFSPAAIFPTFPTKIIFEFFLTLEPSFLISHFFFLFSLISKFPSWYFCWLFSHRLYLHHNCII
jgi:hypothetical protein